MTSHNNQPFKKLMFLSWESPWPAKSGGAMRTWGLFQQLAKYFNIELVVLSQEPLSRRQKKKLNALTSKVTRVAMKTRGVRNKLSIFSKIIGSLISYHCAIVDSSFENCPDVLAEIRNFPGVVYASYSHWGVLLNNRSDNWILDQHNADVHFWQVYISQTSNILLKLFSAINWILATFSYPRIYSRVGRIISVCEKDKELTKKLTPDIPISVVENGVDCAYFVPNKKENAQGRSRILFTGTSVPRNLVALRHFIHDILPHVNKQINDIELLVAGNFSISAQEEFRKYKQVEFTGYVDDIRPSFNKSDVFIAPFDATHGSKLKIAEAMAMGMAIVSTSEGIRGFSLNHGKSVMLAKNDREFADYVVELINNPGKRNALGKAARKTALDTIDWRVLGKRLRATIKDHIANKLVS